MVKEVPGVSRLVADPANKLQWYRSLNAQLMVAFVLLIVILGGIAIVSSTLLTRNSLVAETLHDERENGYRLSLQFNNAAERAQTLAISIASMVAAGQNPSAAQLAELLPDAQLIDAVGIWPTQERSSLLWLRDGNGILQPRDEYNDPRSVSYIHEKWYTPARRMAPNHCYWTPAYRDALSHRSVLSCGVPIPSNGGVVTVTISLDTLQSTFAKATEDENGYSLLLDEDNQILALSPTIAMALGDKRPRNLAELSQLQPALNPLALALNQLVSTSSAGNNAAQINALRADTRSMSSAEATVALAQIAAIGNNTAQEPQQLGIEDDPIVNDDASANVFALPGVRWHLINVTSSKKGLAGASHLFHLTLLINVVMLVLILLLMFLALRYLVALPLNRMVNQLLYADDAESALQVRLQERPPNEIGALADWHGRHISQIKELIERVSTTHAQLSSESEERRNSQEALARLQERAALVLQSVADGVISTDALGRIDDMNPIAEQLTGQSLRSARGKAFNEIFTAYGKNGAAMPNLALMVVQRGARFDYSEGIRLVNLNGQAHDIQLTVTPIRTRQNRVVGAVIVFRRGNVPVAAGTSQLEERLPTDASTGLPMRAALNRRLNALADASRGPRKHALVLVDIDQLKRINDSAGPEAGDEAIVRVANIIHLPLGKDAEIFRLSNAHFAVLLENQDSKPASAIAETLRAAVAAMPFEWESKRHALTASFGVAVFDNRAINPAEALHHAESACRAAKHEGRNRVVLWHEGLSQTSEPVDDAVWIRRLRSALDQNRLHLTTQAIEPAPKHQAAGQVFEVLVTLEDEEGFWSNAATFIPVAERHQMAHELDSWVISRTITHLQQHAAQAADIDFVTINLSADSLSNSLVLEHIVKTFEQNPEVPARLICFEISEEIITSHMRQAQLFSEAMRGLGCRMSIDHFSGRDLSDLNLLRRLPINLVKIDALQFRNILNDRVEQALAEFVINMARELKKQIIVNNLEDNMRLDAWRKLGVDYFQGHIVAKPTPVIFSTAR